ncbi:Ig-like domain-containing protein [Planktotalea sp.]|uniref:Ig-like domain-containing protein n=1 Tax=Planktotalea sp. TaxID=2029877 RepID=UPI003297352C
MPDLRLSWGDYPGGYATELSTGSETIETGGVAVTVDYTNIATASTAFALNLDTYDDPGDDLPPNSQLKLIGDSGTAGDTSSTTLSFASSDPLYGDAVTDLSFRIDDIDAGAIGDIGGGPSSIHEDVVTIRAFDLDGNEIPVTITAGAGITTVGQTLDGDTQGLPTDAAQSALIEIAGPVGSVTIDYANTGTGEQEILVSDLLFTTTDPNEDPVANPDTASTLEDTLLEDIDVLGNDTDPDGDTLSVLSASAPNGTVTINGDGTLNYDPTPGFTGVDTITYEISDGLGGTDTSTVTVTVSAPANTAPTANDDTATATSEVLLEDIDVLGNDTDPDGDPLDVTAATAANGTVTINADGTLNYISDAGFVGEDTITYTIDDNISGTDTADVIVTVAAPANTAPTANDDTATATSEVLLEDIDVLGNDTDPDGDPLDVTAAVAANGTVTINADGTLNYVSDAGFVGEDTITYTIDDNISGTDTADVIVTVAAPGNTAPTANDDTAVATSEVLLEDIDVLGNDTDPDGDPLDVTAAVAANGTVTINADGTLNYTSDAGFVGEDTITYTIDDNISGTDTAEVIVTVTATPNDLPVANDDTATATSEVLLEDIDVLGNDTDPDGDPLDVTAATAANGTVTINADGTLNYISDAGFVGDDTITYTIDDNISGTDTAEVIVSVSAPVNEAPEGQPDLATTTAGVSVTVFPLGNDTDPNGDTLVITAASAPNGTVTISPDQTNVTYTPDPGFNNDVDTITYTLSDPFGLTDETTIQVIVGTPLLDGIVEGTAGDDLIIGDDTTTAGVDEAYMGDPEGDEIDNSDAIFPEAGANDDVVQAGAGDDTVISDLGDDFVTAGEGDDDVSTGEGNDTVFGDAGNDLIDTGEGNDSVFSGDDNDTITTGDGVDTVLAGLGDDVIDTSGGLPLVDEEIFAGIPFDADPDDDRDFVDADEGNDLITTGDDADTIIAGEGDDTINSGIDDDSVIGDGGNDLINDEQGSDFVDGGAGDDTINVGIDSFSDYVGDDPNLPVTVLGTTYDTDPNAADGLDTVLGGDGNDVINTGDDADSIDGGADNDTINAGIDDDTVLGGSGDDSILGGHGSDDIDGGTGDDFIDASHAGTPTYTGDLEDAFELPGLELNDRDTVEGGEGSDTIIGGDDDDSLSGGDGADSIDGGIDEDTLLGGAGDDTLIGGAGADSISGGDDQDSIIGATVGDTVDGGAGGVDFDTLDLRGAGDAVNPGGRVTVEYTSADLEDGIVRFLDAGDVETGTMTFTDIENVIPCFTPGTMIATPQGERAVEDLQVGDRVITRDNGIQEICWTGSKGLNGAQLAANEQLQPILIQAGALGNNLPERDILVSPQHRMLLTTDKAAMYFEEREVLVAAKHLTMLEGVDRVESSGTTYIHIMFQQHEVVLSNGTWSESFQPGDYSLEGIGQEQRDEILELFPELATQQNAEVYQAARRTLKKYEAALLLG